MSLVIKKKQLKINFFTNTISFITIIAIGIFYTPYLVKNLGIVAYGIIPLALVVNQYMGVITDSLTNSLTRFYTVSLQKGDYKEASDYLTTSIIVILGIIFSLLPILFIFINNFNLILNIPNIYLQDSRILFLFTYFTFSISLFTSVLDITQYALNRLDWINIVKICRTILKFSFVILLFVLFDKRVQFVAIANFFAEFFVLLLSILFFIRSVPKEVKIKFDSINFKLFYSVFGMTIWTLLHQIGDVGLYRTDNFLINMFFSTKESGILGAFSQISIFILLMVSVISSLFGPLTLIEYSKNNHLKVQNLVLNNSLLVGLITSIITGILIGASNFVVNYWLGKGFTEYNIWLIFKLITIPTYAASGVFAFTYRAWNKVKFPALITLVIGLLNLLIMYTVLFYFKKDIFTIKIVLIISVFLIFLQSYGLNSYWFNRIYKGHGRLLIKNFLLIILMLIFTAFSVHTAIQILNTKSYLVLFIVISFCSILSFVIVYYIILSKETKAMLLTMIKKGILT